MTAPRAAAAEPGHIALEGGDARIEVVPAMGGRVRSLRLGGREWLVQGGPESAPRNGAGVLAGAGWDECAPAAGGGIIPTWVTSFGGRPVPDGGEARLQVPELDLRTGSEGHRLTCTWHGRRLRWVLTRTLLVRPDGAVEARYEAVNHGQHRMPFLWSACLILPLDDATRITMPESTRFRVQSVTGARAAGVNEMTQQWPRLVLDERQRDLTRPWQLPRRSAVNGWVDLASPRTTTRVTQGATTLSISTDGEGAPCCGVLIDRGGVRTGERKRAFGDRVAPALVLRPSLGAPDNLADALGDWLTVTWLAPDEPRHWTMTLRAETPR